MFLRFGKFIFAFGFGHSLITVYSLCIALFFCGILLVMKEHESEAAVDPD